MKYKIGLGLNKAAVLLLILASVALAACQPRERVPGLVTRLLPADRDKVAYRSMVLDNRLKVMLVSNPSSDRSAAALAVGVGSLDDPPEAAGMAHFLEHMLFLGTQAYPEVGEYSKYMGRYAGFSNAYTADDHTNYFFSVANGAFEGGLDRFAHFFIDPLFDQSYAEREMNAVDSEHAKNIENDYWRMRQVQRLFFMEDHPITRFSTGTKETLKGVGRDALLAFYRGHYSANRMTLSVVGPQSLDELEAMVRGRFDRIPDRDIPPIHRPGIFLERKEALRVVQVRPVADERMLSMLFPLPPVEQDYRAAPLNFISGVLGHEGEGSLLSLLKKDQLATSLSVGGGESTSDYASLSLTIGLTKEGLQRYQDVIERVFSAIAALKKEGIPRYLFEEQRTMAALNHRFRALPEAASQARQFSALMQRLPLKALPDDPFLLHDYRPDLYKKILAHLTPDNLLITLAAQSVPVDRTEKYYGARYGYHEYIGDPYQRSVDARPDPRWHLPVPNSFIPARIALQEPEGPLKFGVSTLHRLRGDGVPESILTALKPIQGVSFTSADAMQRVIAKMLTPEQHKQWFPRVLNQAVTLPVHLLDTEQAQVMYLPDWALRQPMATILLKFFVARDQDSPRRAALGSLYTMAFEESLNEVGYPIREAGLSYNLDKVPGGITLTLGGYSGRILNLLDFLTERLNRVEIDNATFKVLKEEAIRNLENARLDQPYQQARYYADLLLRDPAMTREALLDAIRGITLEDVRAYAAEYLKRTYVQGVVVGNLSQDEARRAIRRTLDAHSVEVMPKSERVKRTVRQLLEGSDGVFSQQLPINNSLMNLMIQVGPTNPKLRGALLILSRHLSQEFYFRMRTQQQLGYIVWGGLGQMRKTLHLTLLVQSGQFSADVLRERIEKFIPNFIESFQSLTPEQFEQYRRAVIEAKLEGDKSLDEIANRLFWMAFRNEGRFDYLSTDIAAVEALSREEVEAVMTRYMTGERVKKLAIRLIGKDHTAGPPRGQPVDLPGTVFQVGKGRAKAG